MHIPLVDLLSDIRSCALCEADLPFGPRPVLRAASSAKVLVVGQAPGRRVHASGVPFDDPSGERLRDWMGVTKDSFYDESVIAIVPMGFCYPGTGKSGDLPPRKLCAETWRSQLLDALPNIALTLVIGQYAHAYHLAEVHSNQVKAPKNLTETVRNWQRYGPSIIPLPHPSPRNNIWLKRNPWFTEELLPQLRVRVANAIHAQ